jgi:transposase
METMERKKPRPRRSFTPEFKADIVDRCRAGDRTIAQVARDFELTETAVRSWVKQAEVDAGERVGLTTDERKELAELRRENRQLREDVGILKRATVFFAKETR